jgi:anti-sigma regulatory factor (Ser/Thr protein kinase)
LSDQSKIFPAEAGDVTHTLRLDMDADPALLGTARLFAVASARLAGCADDVVEDVRLAVSEACTRAISLAPEEGRVAVQAQIVPTGLEVEVRGPAVDVPQPSLPEMLEIDLVPVLFSDAKEELMDGTLTVRFLAPAV